MRTMLVVLAVVLSGCVNGNWAVAVVPHGTNPDVYEVKKLVDARMEK